MTQYLQMTEIIIRQPDDWHIHLRDDKALSETASSVSRYFGRAIVMPNLKPPVTRTEQAVSYKQRIQAQVPPGRNFEALMTLYLTDNTSPEEVATASASNDVYAFKLYPAGATTNSDAGVSDFKKIYPALEAMSELDMPLLIHGEVTRDEIDIFDREKVFINETLLPLKNRFPKLRIVLEHITTKDAVECVKDADENLAATITAHHLLYNRNHMLAGGIRPHLYCLPIIKKNIHQAALIEAATSGDPSFFIGTDSAPHELGQKETACGCAGIYSAHAAIELYAEAFDEAGKLDRLEKFASEYGANFYHLPLNTEKIKLVKESWTVPDFLDYSVGSETKRLIPMRAGEEILWKVTGL